VKSVNSRNMMSRDEFRSRDYTICRLSVFEQIRITAVGAGLCLTADYLFYENPLALLPMVPFPFLYLKVCRDRAVRKRKQELNYQFRDALLSMSAAVQAGYSLENAIHACAKDLGQIYRSDTDIVQEFRYMESQIRVSVPAEELFRDMGRRSGVEDIENFASVVTVCRHMGGDMNAVIQKCARMVADKIDVYREIQTSITAKKAEQNIMSFMPAGIILYLKLTSPGFLSPLYGNLFGILVMTVCLAVYVFAYWLGKRIVEIEM